MKQEEIDIDDYPLWLGDYLINAKLPWDKESNVNFQEFTAKYTLHDSCWIGLFYDVGDQASVTIVIHWDTFWLPDSIALNTSIVKEHPFLFIRIQKVREVSTSGFFENDIVNFSICSTQLKSIGEQQLLIISSCMGGDITIKFLGEMTVLALDSERHLLNI